MTESDASEPIVEIPPRVDEFPAPVGRRIPLFTTPKEAPRWLSTLLYLWAGVIAPAICFAAYFANDDFFGLDWQSGRINQIAILYLTRAGAAPFYPLLILSTLSLLCILYHPARFARSSLMQLGIATGLLLSLHYSIILMIMINDWIESGVGIAVIAVITIIGQILLALAAVWILYWLGRLFNRPWFKMMAGILVVAAIFIGPSLFSVPVLALITSPFWSFVAYLLMLLRIRRILGDEWRWRPSLILWPFGWLALYLGSWRMAVEEVAAEYAALPAVQPDNCYIATAATRGHASLVKSTECLDRSGRVFLANNQLRSLKMAEIVLHAAFPSLHRLLRIVYNILGPRLANCLIYPALADAAYIALKPAEWAARAILYVFFPGALSLAHRLYRTP